MALRMVMWLVLLGSVFSFSRADADAACEKGFHDITPGQRANMAAVLGSVRAAVPEPPTGWIRTLHDDSVLQAAYTELQAFEVEYQRFLDEDNSAGILASRVKPASTKE